ncbi:MAG: sulfatase-like hydrolase/transferase [Chloroflexota bacterium]
MKPNILFLLNDHQLYYRHGWDRGPRIQRPYFDKLAAEGVTFNRAYTACPLCSPARRTMLTGLFPHNHGQLQNSPEHPFTHQTYYDPLAEQGYRNFYYGKWHAGPGIAADHHCEGFSQPGYGNPYLSKTYQQYLKVNGLPHPKIIIERDFSHENRRLSGERYTQTDVGHWEHMTGIMDAPDDAHEAFFLANLACGRLRDIAQSDSDQPFSLRVDFWSPHQPYFPTQRYADLYRPEDIPEYGSFHDDLTDKPTIYQTELNYPMGDELGKIIHPNPLPWTEWQKIIAKCYAQITLTDAAGGRILETLDELGLADNTIVIWAADHGDALACHGGHFNKRCYLPEEVLRIPLAIRYPGVIPAGQGSDHLVSNIDLAPTILAAAGTSFSTSVDGRSLLPVATGKATSWRNDLLCETNGHYDSVIGRVIVTERYKYITTQGDLDELYDLQTDPYELTNLATSLNHIEVLEDMKVRLSRWQEDSRDSITAPDLI